MVVVEDDVVDDVDGVVVLVLARWFNRRPNATVKQVNDDAIDKWM